MGADSTPGVLPCAWAAQAKLSERLHSINFVNTLNAVLLDDVGDRLQESRHPRGRLHDMGLFSHSYLSQSRRPGIPVDALGCVNALS